MNDNENHDHDQKVRDRAYALWEEEGRPEGREHDHWHRAHHEVTGGGGFADSQNGAVNNGAAGEGQQQSGTGANRNGSHGSQQQA